MFTGIVEATAEVIKRSDTELCLERLPQLDDIKEGSSICVSGVCLSVIHFDDAQMTFNVVEETWSKTKLGSLEEGDKVNLERSLKADGRFEGHVVQGHCEGVATVISASDELTIQLPSDLSENVVSKGSIAIDGVSLTVASIKENDVSVALIPHTLEHTTLGSLKEGDQVNIETDILGRYIHAMLEHQS